MAIGTHQTRTKATSDDWITPRSIIDAVGPFDLDPCASVTQPWPCAARSYNANDNGLLKPWSGRVWLNPPYGRRTGVWLEKLAEHGNGVALIFARTETDMFFRFAWEQADAMFFLRGRVHFCRPNGSAMKHNSGGPSVLIAYGESNVERLKNCGLPGQFVRLRWRLDP